jgi:hypothetical protein
LEAFLRILYPPENYMTRLRWTVGEGETVDILDFEFDSLTSVRYCLRLNGVPIYEQQPQLIGRGIPFTIPFELHERACVCVVYKTANELTADLYVETQLIAKVEPHQPD